GWGSPSWKRSGIGPLPDFLVEAEVGGRVDDDQVWLAASGGHDADLSVPENLVQQSLVLFEAVHPVEEHAGFAAEKDAVGGDDAGVLDAIAPAFHADDGDGDRDGKERDQW